MLNAAAVVREASVDASYLTTFAPPSSSSSYLELLNLEQIFFQFSLALVVGRILRNSGKANCLCQKILLGRQDPLCSQETSFLNWLS